MTPEAGDLKIISRRVDFGGVAVVFLVFGVVLGSCGLGLTGLGVSMAAGGSVGPGFVGIAAGVLTSYGAYLFGRAAVRTRRQLKHHPPTPKERVARRSAARYIVGFTVYVAAVNVALPVPVLLRVVSVITVVLVVPVYLAVEFEPPRNRPPGQA